MRKPLVKSVAIVAGFGLFAGSLQTGSFSAKASKALYHDSNVSIIAALDRYVADNEYAFAEEWEAYRAEAALAEADSTAVASIEKKEEKKEDVTYFSDKKEEKGYSVGTGSIKRIDVTEEAEEEEEEAAGAETEEEESYAGEAATFDFSGMAMNVSGGTLNIRQSADADSAKVGTIENGGIMTVTESGDEWTLISSGGVEGYVNNSYVAFGDDAYAYAEANLMKVAVINCASLRMRAEASADSEKLALLPEGESYEVIGSVDGWTQIQLDTVTGYLSNEYIIISYRMPVAEAYADESTDTNTDNADEDNEAPAETVEETTEAPAETEAETTEAPAEVASSSVGQQVVNEALKYVGNPYVYGGNSLTNGTDCSGFTMLILAMFGYSLPHSATAQSYLGTEVSTSALEPGDLVFYDHGTGSIEHVAIYIGNGQIVHASTPATGIMISSAFYSTPFKAVRIAY